MKKVLFVAPHLSTGGCPQYLLKKIQTYKDVFEIYVVEFNFLGYAYVVQRNAIISLLPSERFFSLSEDKTELLRIISEISPDVIHFEELSETMCNYEMLEHIYLNKDRSYFITETTHSSESNPDHKVFLPDQFIFASRYSMKRYEKLGVPSVVWEYPIEKKERPNRSSALKSLELDPKKVHILNVGLFTPGKNQKELIDLARNFPAAEFHFVGNQAPNFEHYWSPLMNTLPENCKIWGERNDIDKFMQACDIFYFSSTFELNPLVVKEALGWRMPVLMYNLPTYMNAYDGVENVHFLTSGMQHELLAREIEKISTEDQYFDLQRTKIVHIVSELNSEIEKTSIESVSRIASEKIEYTLHLNPLTTKFDPTRPPMFENETLKPGHFGCFEAFRKAIVEDFTDDYEFLVVCERDCVLEEEPEKIRELLRKTQRAMKEKGILYFSFGDKVDLDNCYLQSEKIEDIEDFAFVTEKIIGLQFIVFSREGKQFLERMFKERPWYGMDIWLNIVFGEHNMKMGILNDRVTTQLDGYSLIDQTHKTFKANQ